MEPDRGGGGDSSNRPSRNGAYSVPGRLRGHGEPWPFRTAPWPFCTAGALCREAVLGGGLRLTAGREGRPWEAPRPRGTAERRAQDVNAPAAGVRGRGRAGGRERAGSKALVLVPNASTLTGALDRSQVP